MRETSKNSGDKKKKKGFLGRMQRNAQGIAGC